MLKNLNPVSWWLKIDEKLRFDLLVVLVCIIVAFISFGLGRLSVKDQIKEPVRIEYANQASAHEATTTLFGTLPAQPAAVDQSLNTLPPDVIVASKFGKRYHYGRCSGAKTIAVKNRIFFKTPSEAEAAGYTLASNCK